MATDLSGTHTLLDVAKLHNNKEQLEVAQVLHKKNGLFRTATWEEANRLTDHVLVREVGLPTGTWRVANEGVTPENSQFEQFVEPLARLEGQSIIDEMILNDVSPDPDSYRAQVDMSNLEGYSQTVNTAFLDGNPSANPAKPRGIRNRDEWATSDQDYVYDGATTAGTNNMTEIFVAQWGPGKMQLVYPRDMTGEIVSMKDMGRQRIVTSTTNQAAYWGYVTQFVSRFGIAIYDTRAVQRVGNIDATHSDPMKIKQLFAAIEALPDPEDNSNAYIYCTRKGMRAIANVMVDATNFFWTQPDEYGRLITYFHNLPIVLFEAIGDTNAALS